MATIHTVALPVIMKKITLGLLGLILSLCVESAIVSDSTVQTEIVNKFLSIVKNNDAKALYDFIHPQNQATTTVTVLANLMALEKNYYGEIQGGKFKGEYKTSISEDQKTETLSVEIMNCFTEIEGSYYLNLLKGPEDSLYCLTNFYFIPRTETDYAFISEISNKTIRLIYNEEYDSLYNSSSESFKSYASRSSFIRVEKLLNGIDKQIEPSQFSHYFIPNTDQVSLMSVYHVKSKDGMAFRLKLRYGLDQDDWIVEYYGYEI